MPERAGACEMPGRPRQTGPSSCDGLTSHDVNGSDRFEFEIDQAAVRSNENGTSSVDRKPRVRDFQLLAVSQFKGKRHKRLALDKLDDFLFYLFGCHD